MKKKLVVLSGAGISAESGIATFRDANGLWEGHDVMEVASPEGCRKNRELVLDFYNQRRKNAHNVKPNRGHEILAELEKAFDVTIITQNVDDLHERAGSSNVLHLHGEIFKMRSEKNEKLIYDIRSDIRMGDVAKDGAQLRPHIVWFEEPVPMIEEAARIASQADIFVVVGTSLVVYPAAGLLHYASASIPKFILDKRIPDTSSVSNITAIEKTATAGIMDLQQLLQKLR